VPCRVLTHFDAVDRIDDLCTGLQHQWTLQDNCYNAAQTGLLKLLDSDCELFTPQCRSTFLDDLKISWTVKCCWTSCQLVPVGQHWSSTSRVLRATES